MNAPFVFIAILCHAFYGNTSAQPSIPERIDAYIEKLMQCADIPGLTLTVMRKGQDFMAKGYGVRNLTQQEPVTNETMFLINSMTKAFLGVTAATVLKQDSNGFTWQTPVRQILGDWFYLNDSQRSTETTLRDLLAHRVGLPDNINFALASYPEDEAMRRLQYLEFTAPFRDIYKYNNLMYGLAAYVIKTITGSRWEDVARENLLQPLGMNTTTFIWDESRWAEYMYGHVEEDTGNNRVVSLEVPKTYFQNSFSAAGGLVTNALDMRHWMSFHLNDGQSPSGQIILTPEEFQETHTPLNHVSSNPSYEKPDDPVLYYLHQYSMGWREGSYREYRTSQHSGSLGGFQSLLTILKGEGTAVFVGINKRPDYNVRNYIHMYIMDLLLGYEPWLENDTCSRILEHKSERLKAAQHSPPADEYGWDQYISRSRAEDDDSPATTLPRNTQNSKRKSTKQRPHLNPTTNRRAENSLPAVNFLQNMAFEEFQGTYSNYAYGNLTVTVSDDPDNYDLVIRYDGPGWNWNMVQQVNGSLTFQGYGTEPMWYDDFVARFENRAGIIDAVTIYYGEEIPPRFEKFVDWLSPPLPPYLCNWTIN